MSSAVASTIIPKHDTIFSETRVFSPQVTELIDQIRRVNWSGTDYGPISQWPSELHQLLNNIMLDPRPATLVYGRRGNILYNSSYALQVAGDRHPRVLGLPIAEAWPESYPAAADNIDAALEEAAMAEQKDVCIFLRTHFGLQETFYSWVIIPLIAPLSGCYLPGLNHTEETLEVRRDRTLSDVRNACASIRDSGSFWEAVSGSLSQNSLDFPFAFVHSVERGTSLGGLLSSYSPWSARLRFHVHYVGQKFIAILQEALQLGTPVIFDTAQVGVAWPEDVYEKQRGFGDTCKRAVVIAIPALDGALAFVTMGLNTRQPWTKAYERFVTSLETLLSRLLSSIMAKEDHDRLTAEAAVSHDANLENVLATKHLEARRTNRRMLGLQRTLEMSDVGVFEYDPNGKLLVANNSWFNLSGQHRNIEPNDEISFMPYVYEEDQQICLNAWYQLVQERKPVTFEMRWKYQDTHVISAEERALGGKWVLAACVPLIENGELMSIAGMTTDISSQKQKAAYAYQRAEAQQRFRRFADMAPVAIYIVNPDRSMEYCNDKFFELTGHPKSLPTEVDWTSIIHPEDSHIADNAWKVMLKEKRGTEVILRFTRKYDSPDGGMMDAWGMVTSYPELNPDGSVNSVLGALVDISYFQYAQQVERLRTEEALEQKRQQENFIDSTSHEMRNPLSAVLQCADSLSVLLGEMSYTFNSLPEEAWQLKNFRTQLQDQLGECTEAVQTIIACSIHQKHIVDDVLTLSKLDSRLLVLAPQRVSPVAVVRDAVKLFEVEAAKADINLSVIVDDSMRSLNADWLMMDPIRVTQLLMNLLAKAIKFTKQEPLREITVTLGAAGERPTQLPGPLHFVGRSGKPPSYAFLDNKPDLWGVEPKVFPWILVKDTGCGLSATQQERLFLRFSQAFAPRTHVTYGGSGLGLYISKELAELQGGEIGVSSTGVGSTFAFYVATRLARPPVIDQQSRPSHTNGNTTVVQHYTILVVEDNLVNQKVLATQLRKAGNVVYVANHGLEAIEHLKQTTFWRTQPKDLLQSQPHNLDVVLMDWLMPVMDGLQCTKTIRELQKSGDLVEYVPIIAISANARPEQIQGAKEAGMDDAISKPFRIPELIAKIDGICKRLGRSQT